MGYYTDPAYFPVWSKVMMPVAGPPPAEFFYYSFSFSFLTWLLFGFVYKKLAGAITTNKMLTKGVLFGFFIFLVAGIPFTLTSYLLINIPAGLLMSWTISSLFLYLVGGVLAVKVIKI